MAVAHAAYVMAARALRTLEDVERLSHDTTLGLSYDALLSILARQVDADVKATVGHHRKPDVALQHVLAREDASKR